MKLLKTLLVRILNFIPYFIFWGWNIPFLVIAYFGILPVLGLAIFEAGFTGEMPLDFILTMGVLLVLPLVCTAVGVFKFYRRRWDLLRWFYGFEAPLVLLAGIRLFVLRDLPLANTYLLLTLVSCILAYGINLIGSVEARRPTLAWAQLTWNSLMMLMGGYVGLILAFYIPPSAKALLVGLWEFLLDFISFSWVRDFSGYSIDVWTLFFLPLSLGLFVLTSVVFLAMPIAVSGLYLESGWRGIQSFSRRYGWKWVQIGSLMVLSSWGLVFAMVSVQPQLQAFELLDSPTLSRQEKLEQSDLIRKGLVNAYLQAYRYVSPREANNHIRELYRRSLHAPDGMANGLQSAYNLLLSPFLYDGSHTDAERAAQWYAEVFDTSIQKAERQPIQRALQATYEREQINAGLLNQDQEIVWLAQQTIQVDPHPDWADIEIHEVYENTTYEDQEILYAFSLPESAVVTGVWLGDSDDRSKRFNYVVSPRGAAQQVYNQEVRQRVDPALLEQVGPRQYRLRAFPIPAKEFGAMEQPDLHLWLTYRVLQQSGSWPLPQLSERRNIFWTPKTQRWIQGQLSVVSGDQWLPPYLNAAQDQQPQAHEYTLPTGDRIQAEPLTPQDYHYPQDQHLALILDGSYSMASQQAALNETAVWLNELILPFNTVDFYITDSDASQAKRVEDMAALDLDPFVFYGALSFRQMLDQFEQLREHQAYDAVFIMTDAGSYDLATDQDPLPTPAAPLWFAHLGGLPTAYDDQVLAAIQDSGGGVTDGIQEAMQRYATAARLPAPIINIVDGYAWYQNAELTSTEAASPDFAPLAARQWIRAISRQQGDKELAELDAIHTVAKEFSLVSPYSSMIVLVNDRQREALKQAEAATDRFDREVETGVETLTAPSSPFVTGVPEPEEWILLGLGGSGLSLLAWRRYRHRHQVKSEP